jgi:chromosome segregation protein
MRLKHLKLHGYKSFATPTEFEFHYGITTIVGPNGSGKSNVSDAIQWVLGEQAFSHLRAKKTEDMIFAGSAGRPRMGMAEASLTLDNGEGWLPIEFAEVTITRRAYRSGENDYLLNGSKVRLRDIIELLARGGLGLGSYAVIGQGLIDSAVSLRPEERRALLEDAAGISLYQAKKEDARNKLKDTNDNLTRVSDILKELEPRVRRLREQAHRANQLNDVQQKLAERLQTWYGYQWQAAQERLANAKRIAERTHDELLEARQKMQTLDTERARMREVIETQRRSVASDQQTLREHQAVQQDAEQQRAVAQTRLTLLTQQHAELGAELEALDAEEQQGLQARAELAAAATQAQTMFSEAEQQLSHLRVAMTHRDDRLKQARLAQAEAQRNVAVAQRQALDLAKRVAEQTQRLASAHERLQTLSRALPQHQQTLMAQAEAIQAHAERSAFAQLQLDSLIMQLANCAAQFDEAQRQASDTQQRAASLNTQLAEAQAQTRAAQVELETAQRRGIQEMLDLARELPVHGLTSLRALYQVAPVHERLVRAALGVHADALIVQTWADAQRLAAHTQTRQTILVLDSFDSASILRPASSPLGDTDEVTAEHSILSLSKDAGSFHDRLLRQAQDAEPRQAQDAGLLSFITHAPWHRALFHTLLAGVALNGQSVAQDAQHGTLIIPQAIVTAHGELITRHAILTSDASAPNFAALEAQVTAWQQRAQALSDELAQARSMEQQAQQAREMLNAKRLELEGERAQQKSLVDELRRERARLLQEQQTLAAQNERLQAEQAHLQPQVSVWTQTLAGLQRQHDELAATPTQFASAIAEVVMDDELPRQTAQAETRVALLRQETNARQQALTQLAARLQALAAQKQNRATRLQTLSAEIVTLQAQVARLTEQLAHIAQRVEPLQAQLQPALAQLREAEAQLRELEAQERAARDMLYIKEEANSQAMVEAQRREDRIANLREQIESDYELVSLPTDLTKQLTMDLSEQQQLSLELGESAKPVVLPGVTVIPEGLEAEIKSLRNKLRWIGNINPDAPAEYQQEKERFEFMSAQLDDLQQASAALQQLIAELDALMKRKFNETFETVARGFKEFFKRLFGGGSAELVLTDPNDLITTGVDIIAQPPGKRRQALALLSGGERALTAGALIFALLRASPTPFCIMDEVDAALDEANVGRFRDTLVELAQHLQFVIITHNRVTVEAAHTIYGVSMGGDGVSRVLSLRLEGVDVRREALEAGQKVMSSE